MNVRFLIGALSLTPVLPAMANDLHSTAPLQLAASGAASDDAISQPADPKREAEIRVNDAKAAVVQAAAAKTPEDKAVKTKIAEKKVAAANAAIAHVSSVEKAKDKSSLHKAVQAKKQTIKVSNDKPEALNAPSGQGNALVSVKASKLALADDVSPPVTSPQPTPPQGTVPAPVTPQNGGIPAQTATPATTAAPASADAVKDALGKKEGDVDNTALLKETLNAVDKQYSLIKKGVYSVTYDLNYTYIGQEKINTDLSSGSATLFSIENDNSHTITNTVSVDYGVKNNLTGEIVLPIVSKYSESSVQTGVSNTLGDIGLNARYQPFGLERGSAGITLTGGIHLPTGTSPFKVVSGSGIATGNGVFSASVGANINDIVDPVALFGSVNLTMSRAANHISQVLDSSILTKAEPGPSLGFGAGFAYALSYTINTSVSFQESISDGAKLTFSNGQAVKTATQVSGVLNIGLGYRVSPKTTVNTSVGIGLTTSSPNLMIDISLPISL